MNIVVGTTLCAGTMVRSRVAGIAELYKLAQNMMWFGLSMKLTLYIQHYRMCSIEPTRSRIDADLVVISHQSQVCSWDLNTFFHATDICVLQNLSIHEHNLHPYQYLRLSISREARLTQYPTKAKPMIYMSIFMISFLSSGLSFVSNQLKKFGLFATARFTVHFGCSFNEVGDELSEGVSRTPSTAGDLTGSDMIPVG